MANFFKKIPSLDDKIVESFLWFLLISFVLAILGLTLSGGFAGIPHEDAAILYSYSRNLAETGTISYVPGGERVEGATDFGWMLSIAILQKIGITNHMATSILNVSLLLLVFLRLETMQRKFIVSSNRLVTLFAYSLFLLIIFSSGAAISGLGGFSTIAQISLLATIFCSCFFRSYDTCFLLASFFYILLRPDSIVYYTSIVVPFLAIDLTCVRNRWDIFKARCRSILPPLFVFAVYWLIRWSYFQKEFPLPYYVKQSQEVEFGSVVYNVYKELFFNDYNNLAITIVSFLAFLAYIFYISKYKLNDKVSDNSSRCDEFRELASDFRKSSGLSYMSWVSGFGVFAMFYLCQSIYLSRFNLIQNIWDRFHVPALSLAAIFLSIFVSINFKNVDYIRGKKIVTMMLLSAFILVVVHSSTKNLPTVRAGYKKFFLQSSLSNMYPLSIDLSKIKDPDLTPLMFVTEAGKLSYYSRIPTIDTWGLNTPKYASNPLQDPSEVEKLMPDIINMHADFSRLSLDGVSKELLSVGRNCNLSGDPSDSGYCGWHQMNQAVFDGAIKLGYKVYVLPFERGPEASERHDLFLVNPSSRFSKRLVNTLMANNAIFISELSDLKSFNWE